ncbi:glycosyltransferase family 2 protein [Glycomyces xiaoerkulensis]|uniref:glycosyltransferase family 2 protein n=1 Tax=Glycomyces xiaoerkulensis TaxID=2038139 RepID=UPI0012FFDBAE|nr:glycosyltransferase family A protein [Glycomyces xiaoerkulensis]
METTPDPTHPATSVSVIIPCFNDEDALPLCLEAVKAQSRPPDELIVVDDASTDSSAAVAARFGCRIIRQERNRGVSAARNRGIAAAFGDLLFFLDSDIEPHPDAVERAVAAFERDPDLDIVHGVLDPHPLPGSGAVGRYLVGRESHLLHRSVGPARLARFSVAAARPSVFERFGGFDEGLRDCEDMEYSARLGGDAAIAIAADLRVRHDGEPNLLRALAMMWRRSVPLPEIAARFKHMKFERMNRLSTLAAIAAAIAATAAAVLYPPLLLVTAAALVVALVGERGLLGFARANYGLPAACGFALIHLSVLAVTVCGIAVGLAGRAASGSRPGRRPRVRLRPR